MDKPEPLIPNELLPLPDPDVIDIGRFGLCWHEESVLAYGRQVAARYEARIAEPIPMVLYCPACGMQHIDAPEPERSRDELVQKMHQLERARDALRADAERYRHLRDSGDTSIYAMRFDLEGDTPVDGPDLDASIDAARAAQKKTPATGDQS